MAEKVHERLDSWKAIADYLDRDPTTVMRWAKERGLPVYVVPGEGQRRRAVYAYTAEIDAWLRKSADRGAGDRQNDPQKGAEHTGKTYAEEEREGAAPRNAGGPAEGESEAAAPRTVGGPIGAGRTPVSGTVDEGAAREAAEGVAGGSEGRAAGLANDGAAPQAAGSPVVVPDVLASPPASRPGAAPSAGIPDLKLQIPDLALQIPDSASPIPASRSQIADAKSAASVRPGAPRSLWAVFLAGGILIAVAAVAWLRVPPPEPKLLRFEQLTNDGFQKHPTLVTDGVRIYFIEYSRDGCVVAEIPTSGGNPVPIARVNRESDIQDISPDRAELLLIQEVGLRPGSVWILPLLAGSRRRLGTIQAFSAAWSPDGAALAYTTDDGLYLCDADGSNSRRIVPMSGRLVGVHWSPDGRQLCLTRVSLNEATLWEVDRDGKGLRRLFSGEDMFYGESSGFWTPDGKYFIFQASHAGHEAPWVSRLSAGLFRRNNQATCLGPAGIEFSAPAMSPDRSRLYGVGRTRARSQIERFDAPSKQFAPYLPEIPTNVLDLTKDGRWVAYVDDHHWLWKSRNDGGGKVQLTLPPLEVEMPRWSPDGKWIAFMGRDPGQPWKVRRVSAEGGPYGPVTSTDASEGAPTWSPDGSRLAFGGLVSPETRTPGPLVIHIYDLKECHLSAVPGSQGLWTARWSPDGRYIVALTEDSRSLMLFDFRAGKWAKVLTLGQISDLRWSRQGKCIYLTATPPGGEFALFRVKIPGHQAERLTGMGSGGPSEPLALAPDDSPLLVRELSGAEIYALECQFP